MILCSTLVAMSLGSVKSLALEQVSEHSTAISKRRVTPAVPRALEKGRTSTETPDMTRDSSDGLIKPLDSLGGQSSDVVGDWASAVEEEQDIPYQEATGSVMTTGIYDVHFPYKARRLIIQAGSDRPSDHYSVQFTADSSLPEIPSYLHNTTLSSGQPFLAPSTPLSVPLEEAGRSNFSSQDLVFGGSLESSESSPTLSPSAPSTINTYPTPLSETSNSNPLYQGNMMPTFVYGTAQQPYAPAGMLHSGHVPPSSSVEGILAMDNLLDLQRTILHEFDSPTYADCALVVTVNGRVTRLRLHQMLISRSSLLQPLSWTTLARGHDNLPEFHWTTNDQYITTPALIAGIQALYGIIPYLFLSAGPEDQVLARVLSLLAVGMTFGISTVGAACMGRVLELVSFDNLEPILAFALHEDIPSSDNFDEATGQPAYDISRAGGEFYGHHSLELFNIAVDFLRSNFPEAFDLNTAAPSSLELGGLPYSSTISGTSQAVSADVLNIQFGQMPLISTPESTIISTILLSLPFHALQSVLLALQRPEITFDVVQERERRRAQYRVENQQVEAKRARWAERIQMREMEEGEDPILVIARSLVNNEGRTDG